MKHLLRLGLALLGCLSAVAQVNSYTQTNLVTDSSTDPSFLNPWGLSRPTTASAAEAHWWAADQRSGYSTLYDANGTFVSGLKILIPPASGTGTGSPTGTVFYNKNFVFVTLDGTISQWFAGSTPSQPGTGCYKCHTSSAVITVNHASTGAVYTGVTTAKNGTVQMYYAANSNGGVEAYDTSYNPVTLAAGAFTDPKIPAGYTPFGIQSVGGRIYVTFYSTALGNGFVDAFSPAGKLLVRLQNGWFDEPWGIAKAPSTFGFFSNAILVGNTASGWIGAYNATTGAFLGFLNDPTGATITIPGLWAIGFGAGNTDSGPTSTLYFVAGTATYTHGVFGAITAN